jgi:hypothetical protein
MNDWTHNAHSKDKWKNVMFGNYGKSSMNVFANERDITQQRTHVTNLISLVKTITAPLLDVFKTTRKENFEANPNDNGYVGVGHISKNIVWDSNDIPRTTVKETTIDNENMGNVQNNRRNMGYITNEQEAPNTNRQFSGDYEYEGTAHHTTFKEHMVYDTDYNMRQNIAKEGTLIGRAPTDNNVKLWNGVDTINMDIKKLDSDNVNMRQMATDKIYNSIPQNVKCSYTTQKNNYEDKDRSLMNNRVEPAMLDAFRANPYTQPLDSYAWN